MHMSHKLALSEHGGFFNLIHSYIAVVPRVVPPLVQGGPVAGLAGLFAFRVHRFGLSRLPVAAVHCSRNQFLLNLRTRQASGPAWPAGGFPCTGGGISLGTTAILEYLYSSHKVPFELYIFISYDLFADT